MGNIVFVFPFPRQKCKLKRDPQLCCQVFCCQVYRKYVNEYHVSLLNVFVEIIKPRKKPSIRHVSGHGMSVDMPLSYEWNTPLFTRQKRHKYTVVHQTNIFWRPYTWNCSAVAYGMDSSPARCYNLTNWNQGRAQECHMLQCSVY